MKLRFSIHKGESIHQISLQELADYANIIGLNKLAKERYCWQFVLNIMELERFYGVNPCHITEEISALENPLKTSYTKPEMEFQHPPLQGLWHKHFFSSRFLATNIKNHLGGGRLREKINEILTEGTSTVFTEKMAVMLAHRLLDETFNERSSAKMLTGEWIVYAKHEKKNYYLLLTSHKANDQSIFRNIEEYCWPQFPFLEEGSH
jgi:hypothetical protein